MTVPIVGMVEPAEDMNGTRDPTLKIRYKSYFTSYGSENYARGRELSALLI